MEFGWWKLFHFPAVAIGNRPNNMRRTLQTIGLILLGTYPVGVSAQMVSHDPPTPTVYDVARAADPSSMPLAPPAPLEREEANQQTGGLRSVIAVVGSLAVVLGVFFLIVWLLRRASPGAMGTLPGEVFEVLGRASFANHQHVQLLRCGNKLLLVSFHATGTGSSANTLTEITDPKEVDRLTCLCRQARGGNPSKTFRQVLRQVGGGHA